jgi:hypothetical protein
MPARTLRPGNRKQGRDAGIANFSSGQTSHRHWLGSGHRPSPAPRILASVRPGRARDSFSTLGEPTKGFRPHRAPYLSAFGWEGSRCEASSGFGRVDASRSVGSFGIPSMSGARWSTASVFGRMLMRPPPLVALRKEEAGVACEAQVSWVRNGAPAASWHFRISRRMQGRE